MAPRKGQSLERKRAARRGGEVAEDPAQSPSPPAAEPTSAPPAASEASEAGVSAAGKRRKKRRGRSKTTEGEAHTSPASPSASPAHPPPGPAEEPTAEELLLIETSIDGPGPRPALSLDLSHGNFTDEITAPVNVTDFVPELELEEISATQAEPSVEHLLELDDDGDSLASLTLEVEAEPDHPADVVAAGGAIRVDLALGRPGAIEPDSVTAGVAVAPAKPIRSWPGRSDVEPGDATTDLVALARITETSGIVPRSTAPSPALEAGPEPASGDDWLDEVEEDETEDA